MSGDATHDVFVCHASVDKARLVEPLVAALVERCGLSVWLDRFEIAPGDAIGAAIDRGLVGARFAVVVVSPQFWTDWTAQELAGLDALEARDGAGPSRLIPVWAGVNAVDVATRSPRLAARRAIQAEAGIDNVAKQIADHVRAVAPRPLGRSPSYGVPKRRAQAFVGRELDVARLEAALAPGGRVSVAAAIEGLAGVGKTELALQLVDRLSQTSRFPGGIYWLEAEHPELTPLWGGDIADQLEIAAGPIEARARAVLRRVTSEGPALVVLDNVGAWTSATMPQPLPEAQQVALLVTTRHRNLGGASFQHVAIECLAPAAASELLAVTSGRRLEEEAGAEALLGHLGGHTLAIELAGAFLREVPEVSAAGYLERLRAGEALEEASTEFVRYERTVAQAFDATCDRLDEEAKHGLRVAAWFADAEASVALLQACGVGERVRAMLRRFHLIAGVGERWTMHRLVRAYGRKAGSEKMQEVAREAFVLGCIERSEAIDLATGFRIYRDEGEHLDCALERLGAVGADDPERLSAFMDRVGTGAQSSGDLPRAKDLFERALALDLRTLGEDHPIVATARANLAVVLHVLGELPRAKDLLERALAAVPVTTAHDEFGVATRRANLAVVLQGLGDLPRARALLESALAAELRTLGDDHPSVATTRANLAGVLLDMGDLPGAKGLLEHAFAVNLRTFGEGHPTVATDRTNLALVLWSLGDLPRAKDLLEQALASDLLTFGEDSPNVATVRANLGGVLHDLGDLPSAKDLFERALAADLRTFGEDHNCIATHRSNLALLLRDLGELLRARDLLERAIASDLNAFGEGHRRLASRRANLALVVQELGDLPLAKGLLESALDALLPFGEDHPDVATTRANLAGVLRGLGDLTRAKELLERAIDCASRTLGEDHPNLASHRSSLAAVFRALGDIPRAKDLVVRALASDLRNFGEGHPSVVAGRFSLGSILDDLADYGGAADAYALVLMVEERTIGADDSSTAFTRARLARAWSRLGRYDVAVSAIRQALMSVQTSPPGSHHRVQVERIAREMGLDVPGCSDGGSSQT